MNVKYYIHGILVIIKYLCVRISVALTPKQTLWIISERGTDARDNGWWFFRYMKAYHPEIKTKYIISRNSPDRNRLIEYEDDLVEYKSFNHYIEVAKATHLISTHIQGYAPDTELFAKLNKCIPIWGQKKEVFLQHGITKDNIKGLHYHNVRLDLFICGAKCEYEYIRANYGFPYEKNIVQYTGLCRYDKLIDTSRGDQILLMPTWRFWLNSENFINSEYYTKYSELLCSPELENFLENNRLTLVFYPHYEVQKNIEDFRRLKLSNRIIIADMAHFDVQSLLKESSVLITDYSSVFWDFAYMKKPVIFYQFDVNRYRQNQYAEGYFNYKESFGYHCPDIKSLCESLIRSKKNGFKMETQHEKKLSECFAYFDNRNCERVYNAIISL